MKTIVRLLLLFLIIAGGYYFIQDSGFDAKETIKDMEETIKVNEPAKEKSDTVKKKSVSNIEMDGELTDFIGRDTTALIEVYGDPVRKDPTSYGYENWVYTDQSTQYIQFGVKNDKIIMVYAAGDDLSIQPVQIGLSYEKVSEMFDLSNEVSFSAEGHSYRFQLSKEDMNMRPLIKLNEDTFLQFYFDTFENKLSSVRFMSTDVLLAHRPYEIYYTNDLPQQPEYSEEEWKAIQSGMEQQVFELTNVLRNQYGDGALKWNEEAAKVASGHSKDMHVNNYFSHVSLDGRGLKERLSEYQINYFSAGENIAARYTDSPAAVVGWLNSEGHREALLNDQYTHLGVGVYRYYYTQNFLQKS